MAAAAKGGEDQVEIGIDRKDEAKRRENRNMGYGGLSGHKSDRRVSVGKQSR